MADLTTITTIPKTTQKDAASRINKYLAWCGDILQPDLAAYRDWLLTQGRTDPKPGQPEGLSSQTVADHLSTIRKWYRKILRDQRDTFYAMAADQGHTAPADQAAYVNELVVRIENAIDPETAPLKKQIIQDKADSQILRLTKKQAQALLNQPDRSTLRGKRDAAIIATFLCTGVREGELVALALDDFRQTLNDEPALLVRHGKGNKQRMVPYGQLAWCVRLVKEWCQAAEITSGYVFRGIYKGDKKVRSTAIRTRNIERIITAYAGEEITPHALRRTYARTLYDSGVELITIQQNLGHKRLETTLLYIGALEAKRRAPGPIYDLD